MELLEAINGRRSVREYTDEVVNDTVLRELIGLAVQAPSAVNQQPWSFVVIKDRVLLTHISDRAKVHMLKSPLAASASHYHDMLSDPNFQIFYHAPVLIVICAVDAGDWGVEDCALAAENLMLAAYAEGLGTCWIGFAQSWLTTPDGKSALGLPPASTPVAPIILGHPRCQSAPVPRKTPDIRWLEASARKSRPTPTAG
ncbi:MAG: nitroreductase [Methyloceanibacter sp.]